MENIQPSFETGMIHKKTTNDNIGSIPLATIIEGYSFTA